MTAQLFLNEAKFLEFEVEVPNERWFRHQRKGLGYEEEEEATRKIAKKAMKFNTAMEEPLVQTVGSLLAHLKAMDNAVGVSKDYLKRQYNGRLFERIVIPLHRITSKKE